MPDFNEIHELVIMPISSLLDKHFFIDSYQRGYRWKSQQIEDLLKDIDSFCPEPIINSKETSWYCLQPLVVKEMSEEKKNENNLPCNEIWYEVIDGQQRLTTVFLLVHYFNEMWIGKQKICEPNIKYRTRDNSSEFLKKLNVNENTLNVDIDTSNIDYYHISNGYKKIHDWFNKKESFDNNCFQSKLKEKTKVIWYELGVNEDSIDVFTRLNMGKIRLTNAELVKALLLSKESIISNSNFEKEGIRLKQLEIASEWDIIEQQLNEPSFWAFITNSNEVDYPTRIEFLLELSIENFNKHDENCIFNNFYELFVHNKDIKRIWEEKVVSNFEIIKEWYNNLELYHFIGYLINDNPNIIKELLKESKKREKINFVVFLKTKIQESIRGIDIDGINYIENWTELNKVLTLFNVLTVKNIGDPFHKYPFYYHKKEKWSLEHIHAQNSQSLNKRDQWEVWLKDHRFALEKTELENKLHLIEKIDNVLKLDDKNFTKEQFDSCASEIFNALSDQIDIFNKEDMHCIENMALLNVNNNSSLNNSTFAVKRHKILELDMGGSYIPICTKNVFLKYYNSNADNFLYWSKEDRISYRSKIEKTLEEYLEQKKITE